MKLSVIIPWHDSNCEWRFNSVRWLLRRYKALLPDAQLVISGTEQMCPFNRSTARNEGVQKSSGELLLLADADTVFSPEQITAGVALIEHGAPWVIPYALQRYYNLSQLVSKQICAGSPTAEVPEPTDAGEWEHKIDSWAGLLLVSRENFDKAGGYDERFDGWGYEDNAFRAVLDHTVGEHERVDGFALHLWHPTSDAETFGQPNIAANRALYQQYESGRLS